MPKIIILRTVLLLKDLKKLWILSHDVIISTGLMKKSMGSLFRQIIFDDCEYIRGPAWSVVLLGV